MSRPQGEYVVAYMVPVYAYIEFPEPIDVEAEGFDLSDPDDLATLERRREEEVPEITKVIVDDENISAPRRVERLRNGKLTKISKTTEEAIAVLEAVDGPDAEWPGWDFGF